MPGMSRRELLQNGLLLSAVGSVLSPGASGALPEARSGADASFAGPYSAADTWLIDAQLAGAPAIAAKARASTASICTFADDPGQVWMNALAPRLARAPQALGGYTRAPVLFCLHYLGRDYGLGLAALGAGTGAMEWIGSGTDTLIDLRAASYSNNTAAYTWLLLPRSA